MRCKSTYCECSDMNRAHCDALLTDRYRDKTGERTVGMSRAGSVPYTYQLEYAINSATLRQQLLEVMRQQHTTFLDRAVHDCLSRLGLTLTEALPRLTRHVGPSYEEMFLDDERVLRVSWMYEDDSCHMARTFHGPAELIPRP